MAEEIEHGDFTCYGGVTVKGNAVATALAFAGTYYQFELFDRDTGARGTTPVNAQNHVEITIPGMYRVTAHASAQVTNAEQVHLEVYKNNGDAALEDIHARASGRGAGVAVALSCEGYAPLVVGDTIELWIENATSADDITLTDATLLVLRVGA